MQMPPLLNKTSASVLQPHTQYWEFSGSKCEEDLEELCQYMETKLERKRNSGKKQHSSLGHISDYQVEI